MEQLYKKEKRGKRNVYVPVGYGNVPDLHDGIWLVQKTSFGHSISSMVWKVGDIKPGADVVVHGSLQQYEDEIAKYISNITDEKSEECKNLKKVVGGFLRGVPQIANISASDLTSAILRKLATIIDQQNVDKLREEGKLIKK